MNSDTHHAEFAFDGPCGVDYRGIGATVLIYCICETCPVIQNATSHVRARVVGQVPSLLPTLVTPQQRRNAARLPRLRSSRKLSTATGLLSSSSELGRVHANHVRHQKCFQVLRRNPDDCVMRYEEQVVMENLVAVPATGRSYPLGATLINGGANFSVFSRSAASIDLLFFDRVDDARPSRVIPIDPVENRTYHYWHVFVPGVEPGQIYGFRACGPFEPAQGLRFNPTKILLDPYGRAVAVPKDYSREGARLNGDNAATAMKSVVTDPQAYDWEGDAPLKHPWSRTIIYEMHVRGFTAHASSGLAESKRGTYAGLIEKIPYLTAPGRYRSRAASGVSVRCTRCASRPDELLGLLTGFLFCAAPGIQLAPRSTGCLG